MLSRMRDETGAPSALMRVLALLLVIGLLGISVPLLVSMVRWAFSVLL